VSGAGMISRRIRHLGGGATVAIRKRHTLRSSKTGKTPSLTVQTTTPAGASSVPIEGTDLKGRLPRGAKLSFAGDATVYELAAAADAEDGVLTVTLTAALDQEATAGAAVTLEQPYGEQTAIACRTEYSADEVSDVVPAESRRIRMVAAGITDRPEEGDLASFSGGSAERIESVDIIDPTGSDPLSYTLTVGEIR